MSSQRIHQMQVVFSPEEDRLQLKINTQSRTEFRFWLTRRFVKRFWPGLRQALEISSSAKAAVASSNPGARHAMLDFMHQHAISQTDFSTQFQEDASETPLGPLPILVTRARLEPKAQGSYMVSLHPQEKQGIEVVMDPRLLHSFCKLLADAVKKAEWDLRLQLIPTGTQAYNMGGDYNTPGSNYRLN